MLQICYNIKNYRELRNLKIEDVALKLGVHRNTYSNWEKNTEPNIETIKKIAGILGVHYTVIIDGDKESPLNLIPQDQQQQLNSGTVAVVLRRLADIVDNLDCTSIGKMPGEEGINELKRLKDTGKLAGKGKHGKPKSN